MGNLSHVKEVLEMARAGTVQIDGVYEVFVNTNDAGNIPHFHFRDAVDWDKFHACIKIESAEYFAHDGKDSVLNTKQKKYLEKFMREKVSISKYAAKFSNNWELVCFLWDMNNSNRLISDDIVQPDYRKLLY